MPEIDLKGKSGYATGCINKQDQPGGVLIVHPCIFLKAYFEGDGSIMMNLQELETIRGYNLPVKIIIINNDGYLSIKLSQEAFFEGNEFASGPSNGVTIPSFEKIAQAFGINYYNIASNDKIEQTLSTMLEQEGPCIVEVFTHPKERHEPKVVHKGVDNNGRIIPGTLTNMFISDLY
jgi:acetolactate synthase-1/2/3 large subunit